MYEELPHEMCIMSVDRLDSQRISTVSDVEKSFLEILVYERNPAI